MNMKCLKTSLLLCFSSFAFICQQGESVECRPEFTESQISMEVLVVKTAIANPLHVDVKRGSFACNDQQFHPVGTHLIYNDEAFDSMKDLTSVLSANPKIDSITSSNFVCTEGKELKILIGTQSAPLALVEAQSDFNACVKGTFLCIQPQIVNEKDINLDFSIKNVTDMKLEDFNQNHVDLTPVLTTTRSSSCCTLPDNHYVMLSQTIQKEPNGSLKGNQKQELSMLTVFVKPTVLK